MENITNLGDIGYFQGVITDKRTSQPIKDARVLIREENYPETIIADSTTDSSGNTAIISLSAPPVEYSMEPDRGRPYSTYHITIEAKDYETVEIENAEIFPGQTALQQCELTPIANAISEELFVIEPHTLYEDYPPKIPEEEIKMVQETGEVVLSKVVIPEYIVVHDGPPGDATAKNYYVKYKDYIKNVASSEIYATWPEATITANVLAIQSITLNRVYTEWYRNRGYDFTITSSTAYDQKWINGRNIYESISQIVDTIFANYISKPNVMQPLFTQYCDGKKVSCPNWMRQWESKDLGAKGYSAINILKYFYGNSIYINSSEEISGIPSSWPGTNLQSGSRSEKVRQIQNQLNTIAGAYPLIPKIAADGIYGPKTEEAVKVFQKVFKLPQTGIIDYPTWYKISEIYVGVSRIAELR